MEKFLKGDAIYLRAFLAQDVDQWYRWFNNPEVTVFMNKGQFPNTLDGQMQHYESLAQSRNDIQLAMCSNDGDQLVGTIGLHQIDWIHRKGDISILIDKPFWGHGFSVEAIGLMVKHGFSALNLRRLGAGMISLNVASQKCFLKNGFVQEGIIREAYYIQGKYVDEIRLGLLKKDWVGNDCQ